MLFAFWRSEEFSKGKIRQEDVLWRRHRRIEITVDKVGVILDLRQVLNAVRDISSPFSPPTPSSSEPRPI